MADFDEMAESANSILRQHAEAKRHGIRPSDYIERDPEVDHPEEKPNWAVALVCGILGLACLTTACW